MQQRAAGADTMTASGLVVKQEPTAACSDDGQIMGSEKGSEEASSVAAAAKRKLGEDTAAEDSRTPTGKRPHFSRDAGFVAEFGRTLSGHVDHAAFRQLRRALVDCLSANPAIDELRLLRVLWSYPACTVRGMLHAMAREGVVERFVAGVTESAPAAATAAHAGVGWWLTP